MFAKLAYRNVKRQMGNYLVYFITVTLTVALMFAVNNAVFSEQLLARAATYKELKSGLILLSVFVSLMVSFILGYATSFMLKLRKREFGTYLTLGMTRGNILSVFVLETLLMCAAALIAGLCLGFLLYQGLMLLLVRLMEIEFVFSAYSLWGLLLTVFLVVGMFFLSSLTSAFYLRKVSVYELLHADKKVERGAGQPVMWLLLTLLSTGMTAAGIVLFYFELKESVSVGGGAMRLVLEGALFAAGVILFHVGLSKSITYLLMRNKRFKSKGANTFTLRQLSAKLSSNAVLAGILAFLVTFAMVGSNVSFLQKAVNNAELLNSYPYDVNGMVSTKEENAVDLHTARDIISRYATIEEEVPYSVYTNGENYLHSFTRWHGDAYSSLTDSFLALSRYNALLQGSGRTPVQCGSDEFLIVADTNLYGADFRGTALRLNGKSYTFAGLKEDSPHLGYTYFYAVVPDEAVTGMTVETQALALNLKEKKFDCVGMREALTYTYELQGEVNGAEGAILASRCDFAIREYGRIQRNTQTAVFTLSILYVAVIFVFMAMAVLALKTLSSCGEDRERYTLLRRLGANRAVCASALFRQVGIFFLLPFVLPVLLSIPVGFVCVQMLHWVGYMEVASQVAGSCAIIAGALTAVYGLYFTATYLLAKGKVLADG